MGALRLVQVLDAVDSTVVNMAPPAIEDESAFAATDLSWVAYEGAVAARTAG
ncbi:hypothetical protein ACIBO5_35760 [Nonomuraea angiospora]|uniref:hypothetical protein n=1 Tax=Nonomuraea angiospora TaxID=46172 RepID=UPI0029B295CD|nr:hypothetical protein [Nonomuraea angiospora]MDX3104671.1 hypothetical protein [Nonomuraea angiospora]